MQPTLQRYLKWSALFVSRIRKSSRRRGRCLDDVTNLSLVIEYYNRSLRYAKKKKLQHLIRDFNKRYRDRQTYWERIRAFHDRWSSLWWSLLLNVLSTFSGTVFLILIMLTSLLQPSRLLISTLSPSRARCLEFMIYIRGARKKMCFARCKFSWKMPLIACEFHCFFWCFYD